MKDEDRADKLARAIEEMVQGRIPADLDDEELEELLQIARIRLDAAREAADASAHSRDAVLERLIARLRLHRETDGQQDGSPASPESPLPESAEHDDIRELQNVIDLRRQMAEHAAAISERHREAVWHRVQARIQAQRTEKRGFFRWPFRRRDPEADEFAAALDRMILGEPIWEANDSRLAELLRVAHARRLAAAAGAGHEDRQARVWARLRPRLMAGTGSSRGWAPRRRWAPPAWPKLAAAGAAFAVAAALLGPLPATGLSDHPAAAAVRFLGERVGVTETSSPPPAAPVTGVVTSTTTTAGEASDLLGFAVHEPTYLPPDYELVWSRYYPNAITARDGGVFVLAYQRPTDAADAIVVFQESARGETIAVQEGFAEDISLPGGVPATYMAGTWQAMDGAIDWGNDGAQTILFDLNGVRTIVRAPDNVSAAHLISMAGSLAAQAAALTN